MSSNDKDSKPSEVSVAPEQTDGRRRLLKTLAAGGVAGATLPAQWTKPVIEAVMLPAHAQATTGVVVGGGGGGGASGGPAPAGSVGESILNFFVSPAEASVSGFCEFCAEITVNVAGGAATAVTVTRILTNSGCKSGLTQHTLFGGTLTGSGPFWSGTVNGNLFSIANLNPLAAPGQFLCNANFGPVSGGTLIAGNTCSANCVGGSNSCLD